MESFYVRGLATIGSELLTGTFQLNNLNDSINEFELQKFRKYIDLLNEFIITQEEKNYLIENLLRRLIVKQNSYQFRLEIEKCGLNLYVCLNFSV
ncbi:unnamed protein product [Didymodactylos carnosus]|uniref:Uncharacterized protein n=1 Tax=Didymodactylos carnosus TaxID=1234261 RepID=A0A815RNQ7_9BILA|nr:unnamed protein product [Didymodactylos carnosus]CAF4343909.1 unnamed protein product [Didymodactylos carnosus]